MVNRILRTLSAYPRRAPSLNQEPPPVTSRHTPVQLSLPGKDEMRSETLSPRPHFQLLKGRHFKHPTGFTPDATEELKTVLPETRQIPEAPRSDQPVTLRVSPLMGIVALRDGKATEEEQVRVSRITVVVLGVISIVLGILAMDQNVAFLVSLAFAIAASANLPTILFSLFWKKFNTTGALASMYTGLISSLTLIFFSPAVSGSPTSMLPNIDFSIFPLTSPGLVSIPLAFLAGIVGTYLGKPDNMPGLSAEMSVRSLTGVGVEAPVDH